MSMDAAAAAEGRRSRKRSLRAILNDFHPLAHKLEVSCQPQRNDHQKSLNQLRIEYADIRALKARYVASYDELIDVGINNLGIDERKSFSLNHDKLCQLFWVRINKLSDLRYACGDDNVSAVTSMHPRNIDPSFHAQRVNNYVNEQMAVNMSQHNLAPTDNIVVL